jgi:hypothetical protein
MKAVMLSTIDNPFNPFTQWDEWKRYDEDKKHFSCSLLDRIATTSYEQTEEDYNKALEDAIDEILKYNVNGLYTKVYENEN